MEYRIEEAVNVYSLEFKVRELIKDGWVPCGGVAVGIKYESNAYFYQAMIRYKSEQR